MATREVNFFVTAAPMAAEPPYAPISERVPRRQTSAPASVRVYDKLPIQISARDSDLANPSNPAKSRSTGRRAGPVTNGKSLMNDSLSEASALAGRPSPASRRRTGAKYAVHKALRL